MLRQWNNFLLEMRLPCTRQSQVVPCAPTPLLLQETVGDYCSRKEPVVVVPYAPAPLLSERASGNYCSRKEPVVVSTCAASRTQELGRMQTVLGGNSCQQATDCDQQSAAQGVDRQSAHATNVNWCVHKLCKAYFPHCEANAQGRPEPVHIASQVRFTPVFLGVWR